jgi:hypothetical protein
MLRSGYGPDGTDPQTPVLKPKSPSYLGQCETRTGTR